MMTSKKTKTLLVDNRIGQIISTLFILSTGLTVAIFGAALILWWRKLTQSTFKSLGLYKPKNWFITVVLGILLGLLIKFVFVSIIMPGIGYVPGSSTTFSFLKGNLTNALWFSVYVIIVGGFSEELIFRGFFFRQFEGWFGKRMSSKISMVVIGSLIFGIPHIYQGGFGVIQSVLVGSIYGCLFLLNNRNLWMIMISHAVFDLFSIYIIYHDLSEIMAKLLF